MNSDASGLFSISQPNSRTSSRLVTLAEINRDYLSVDPTDAELNWVKVYKSSKCECSHMYGLVNFLAFLFLRLSRQIIDQLFQKQERKI